MLDGNGLKGASVQLRFGVLDGFFKGGKLRPQQKATEAKTSASKEGIWDLGCWMGLGLRGANVETKATTKGNRGKNLCI